MFFKQAQIAQSVKALFCNRSMAGSSHGVGETMLKNQKFFIKSKEDLLANGQVLRDRRKTFHPWEDIGRASSSLLGLLEARPMSSQGWKVSIGL